MNSKKTFQLRDGLLSYSSLKVLEGNSLLKDFEPKPCKKCHMFNAVLDSNGVCDLCNSLAGCEA